MHCTYVREGKVCGAPTYQSPCAACLSWARSMQERGLLPPQAPTRPAMPAAPSAPIIALMDHPKFRAVHTLLHHLWTKNVGGHLYDKKEWEELEAAIEDIARNGIGPTAPAPLQNYGDDLTASLGPPIPVLPPSQPRPLPADLMSPITVSGAEGGHGGQGSNDSGQGI